MATSNRTELREQAIKSIEKNTDWPYKLFTLDGMKDGEMKTVNKLIESIDYDWEYVVRCDDDMYLNKNWLKAMYNGLMSNLDVKLLGGCRYPTHNILETRPGAIEEYGVHIMDIAPGNHWMISRETWEKFGPFYEDFIEGKAEDVRFCRTLQEAGYKVGCLANPFYVVHCGTKNTKGRGRSPYVEGYTQALADVVGAKTNA